MIGIFLRQKGRNHLLMKRFSTVIMVCSLSTVALAQQKSARSYWEEARQAGALPTLPYVCFRNATETSRNPGVEAIYTDPTYAMLGTSEQIADIIQRKTNGQLSDSDQQKLEQLRGHEQLFIDGFDHGVDGGAHLFERKDPSDPSRADWVFEGTTGALSKPYIWDFNINWGTLRFRETLTMGSDSITYYGQCQLVGR
jgi:hypothetical protein